MIASVDEARWGAAALTAERPLAKLLLVRLTDLAHAAGCPRRT